MKIFYHNDWDGCCSAAILYDFYGYNEEIEYIQISYHQVFPIEKIKQNEIVWLVDFYVQIEDMNKLFEKQCDVRMIDHHKTCKERFENYPRVIDGLRDIKYAGCELVWKFLYGNEDYPDFVKYVGDRDVWRWAHKDNTKNYCLGIDILDQDPCSKKVQALFNNGLTEFYIEKGKSISEYVEKMDREKLNEYSYAIMWNGIKCLMFNTSMKGSQLFKSLDDGTYGALIPYAYNGKEYICSIYAGKNSDIDVSEICKKYGGGGHKGAAGFQCKKLPWEVE